MSAPYENPYGGPAPAAGMTDNVAGGLAYITVIPAILFLIISPYNRRPFIRFHAFQCIFLALAGMVASVLHLIPFFGTMLAIVIHCVIFVLWLIALALAFQGKKFVIPFIGPFAEQAAASS